MASTMFRRMPRSLAPRVLVGLGLIAGLVLRYRGVFQDDGIYWPDEIYQSLEPAHRLVFGYGLVPWEFVDGARTWALPGFVALLFKLCSLVGATHAVQYITVVKGVFALLSLGAAGGVYRLVRVHRASETAAAAAAVAWALCVPSVYFAARAMSENAAAALAVWGLALVLDRNATRRWLAVGASLLGMAVLVRLQASLFCVGAVAILSARRAHERIRGAQTPSRPLFVLAVLSGWALAFGILDAATWHSLPGAKFHGFFHSAVVYLRFNLIEDKASGWGVSPWHYYAKTLWTSMPEMTVAMALGAILSVRRAPGLLLTALLFLAVHAKVGHKEYRFILPVVPLLCALVGVGAAAVHRHVRDFVLVPAVLVAAALSARHVPALTFGELGAYAERPAASAWDDHGDVNRLLLAASRRSDLCGLRVDVAHLAWTGGSTYLHRDAPLYMSWAPTGYYNYVIGSPELGTVIAMQRGIALVRLPGVTCTKDVSYTWRLP